jgi:hypothetical protein
MNFDERTKQKMTSLIEKGKELLEDESLNDSSGKLSAFRAAGKTLLKDNPELAVQFEKTTHMNAGSGIADCRTQEASHKCAVDAVKRGIDFLEILT